MLLRNVLFQGRHSPGIADAIKDLRLVIFSLCFGKDYMKYRGREQGMKLGVTEKKKGFPILLRIRSCIIGDRNRSRLKTIRL